MRLFKELYNYSELLKTNVKKDIRGKYKGSFLGVLWSFVNPLLSVLVYAIVFPYIMRIKTENYLLFLIVGIIPWTFFVMSINQGMTSILSNANIIKKVYFPRIILPISVVTSGVVNFLISCIIIVLFVIFSGVPITWHLLWLPIILIVQYTFILGITIFLSAINVYIRDIEYIIGFFINMLFYLTPILYPISMVPANLRWIVNLNPMAHIINAYRDIFYMACIPDLKHLGIVFVGSLIWLFISCKIFHKLEKGFAEEV